MAAVLSQHPPNSNASDNGVGTEATDGNTVNLDMQRYIHVRVYMYVCVYTCVIHNETQMQGGKEHSAKAAQ